MRLHHVHQVGLRRYAPAPWHTLPAATTGVIAVQVMLLCDKTIPADNIQARR